MSKENKSTNRAIKSLFIDMEKCQRSCKPLGKKDSITQKKLHLSSRVRFK